jgi:hypothetical protein
MTQHKKLSDPGDEVIFKCTLDYLMKKIGGQKHVNIGPWKVVGKGLRGNVTKMYEK